jgi:hypothetical protein
MAGTARTPPDTPSIGASLLGMAIYLVILIGVTLFMVRARDVTA